LEIQFKRILKGIFIAILAFNLTFAPMLTFTPMFTVGTTAAFANIEDTDDEDDGLDLTDEGDDDENDDAISMPTVSAFEDNRAFIIENPSGEIDGHRLIVQNENLELYLKEATLSVIVRNRLNGAVLYSTVAEPDPSNNIMWQHFTQSGVTIEYLTNNHVHPTRITLFEPGLEKTVIVTDNGFEAQVYFPNLQLGYTLIVGLTETGIIAEIPDDSWIEAGENLISGLYIFPFLGYTHLGNREGYMFIPDGSGALIYLQNNNRRFSQPFRGEVFGGNAGITLQNIPTLLRGRSVVRDAQNVLMPVFGMVHTDSQMGFLGIIEGGGEFNAVIEAYPNGAVTNYDWITARFVYRQSFTQVMGLGGGALTLLQTERNNFDARIQFEIVAGDEANYAGLAHAYRSHLLETEQITPTEEAFRVRMDFLGLEQESGMFFNRNVVMTTVADIEAIQSQLAHSGVENILGIYRGWQHNGLSVGTMVRRFRTASSLGGNRALTRLLSDLESTPMDLYLFTDPLRINAAGVSPLRFSAIRQINRQIFEETVYQPVVGAFNFLQPHQVRNIFEGLRDSYGSNNVAHIMLGGISNQVFSHRTGNTLNSRNTTADTFQEMARETNEQMSLLLEQPFAYLWAYTDAFIDAPVQGSSYVFTSREVPFLAIVLRGLIPLYSEPINFEANRREFFLQLVEQGIRPSFYITMESPELLKHTNSSHIFTSEFDAFEDMIVAYYHELREIYELTLGATIERHERVNDLVTVEYSNGVLIYINFSTEVRFVDGIHLEPLSYQVVSPFNMNVEYNNTQRIALLLSDKGGDTR